MANASITINDLNVQTALAKMSQILTNKQPVLNAIGGELKKRVQLGFRNSQTPYGVPWAPLKKRKGKPLVDTTRLRDSIDDATDSNSVSVGTNVVYAAVQNFGYTFQRAARSQHAYFKQGKDSTIGNRFVKKDHSNFAQRVTIGAHTVTIPARQFFPENTLPPVWQDAVLKVIQRHINQVIG